jgi:hypothetical protein
MPTWTFEFVADRSLTPAEERGLFDRTLDLADGDIGYASGGGHPTVFHCDIDTETLEEAVTEATRRIHEAVPGLKLTPDFGREPTDTKI